MNHGRGRLAALVLLAALASSARAEARQQRASLRRTSRAVLEALVAGDAAKVKSFVVAHAQLAAITRRAPPKRAYRRMVERWIKKRVRELTEGKKRGKQLAVGKSRVRDVHLLPKGSKLLRPLVFASVRAVLRIDGKERPTALMLFFVDVGGRWRLSIKK